MTRYFIFSVIIIIVGYGLVEAWPAIAGPTIAITSPANYTTFPSGIVTVSGKVARATDLAINGANILHQENGDFLSTITLPRGGSILTLVATDRFGKRVTATRNVFVPF